jgi:hypothetical protein
MKKWIGKINNKEISEENEEWEDIKNLITSLSLDIDGQKIELPDNLEYIQGKTASCQMFSNSDIEIESRFIGFKLRNNIITIRVDEKTNNIKIEIK